MRKTFFVLTMLISSGLMMSANGSDMPLSPASVTVVKKGSVYKVFYKNEKPSKVTVKIYNDKGKAIYMDAIGKVDGFVRPYNLSALKTGEYTIEVADESGKHLEKVFLSDNQGEADKRLAKLMRLAGEDNRYLLMVPNEGDKELTIKIYDEADVLIYRGTEKVNGNFSKIYNVGDKKVTFKVMDENGSLVPLG